MNMRNQFVALMLALSQSGGALPANAAQQQVPDNTYHSVNCAARTSDSLLLVTAGKLWNLATWTIDPQNGTMHGRAANVDYNTYPDGQKDRDDSGKFIIDIDATFDKAALQTFNPASLKNVDDDHPPIPTRITRVVITHKTGDEKNPLRTTVYNLSGDQLVLENGAAKDPALLTTPVTGRQGKQSAFSLPQRMTVWVSANDALADFARECEAATPAPASATPKAPASVP